MRVVNAEILKQPWNWAVIGLIALFWLVFIVVISPNPTGAIEHVQ